MKKTKVLKPLSVVIGVLLFIGAIMTTFFISDWLLDKKYETQQQADAASIIEKDQLIAQYHGQVVEFAEMQNDIRSYVNELVELLYARESYLPVEGVGGAGNTLVLNEQTPLFELKEVISDLNDDQRTMEMVKDYLIARRQFAESFPFVWPIPGGVPRVSSGYGVRANEEIGSVLGEMPDKRSQYGVHFHAGIDVPGDIGDPVQATADGRVVWIREDNPVYGVVIILQHDYGFQTLYGHLNESYVKWGQVIKRGDIIGTLGNSGVSTGPHVHYEIKKDGFHIDPMDLLGLNM